ncbi:MAG TPA: LytTR family DNA-binding domain-containing protein [Candidatus Aquilonibacter sp.]|jgi:two-component system LytT family response regulator|nr:LytTR family DNA-binding domain-containing protein [Candidatus Aquilonibacter sp.]
MTIDTMAERKAVMEITALIVDDEPAARRRLRSLIETDPEVRIVGECGDGVRAAEMIRQLKPALIFLDVQIPGADGFGVLEEIADRRDLPAVVFVTAHREYAIPAFEAQALDYLLKPFKRFRFFEVLARAKSHILRNIEYLDRQKSEGQRSVDSPSDSQEPSELLLIKSRGRLLFLRMSELKWVEAERDYVRLHLEKDSHFIRDTMNNFQRRLNKNGFIRIHRSTIVNINEICEILPLLGGDYSVVLRDKTELTLSRRYRSSLDDFLRRKLASLPKSV